MGSEIDSVCFRFSPFVGKDDSQEDAVGTGTEEIKINSWNELYKYLKEIQEEMAAVENEGEVGDGAELRLEVVADGERAVLQGSIGDVVATAEAAAAAAGAGDDGQPRTVRCDREFGNILRFLISTIALFRIEATEADWTFLQDNMVLQGRAESSSGLSESSPEPSGAGRVDEKQLTEDERLGKELYDKATRALGQTRSQRRAALDLFEQVRLQTPAGVL